MPNPNKSPWPLSMFAIAPWDFPSWTIDDSQIQTDTGAGAIMVFDGLPKFGMFLLSLETDAQGSTDGHVRIVLKAGEDPTGAEYDVAPFSQFGQGGALRFRLQGDMDRVGLRWEDPGSHVAVLTQVE